MRRQRKLHDRLLLGDPSKIRQFSRPIGLARDHCLRANPPKETANNRVGSPVQNASISPPYRVRSGSPPTLQDEQGGSQSKSFATRI
jgi:hypothetical protein